MSGIARLVVRSLFSADCARAKAETPVRELGRRMMEVLGPGLRAEAERVAGPAGLAQAEALIDIVRSDHLMPRGWPVDEMIDLLAGDEEASRCEPLIRALCVLAWKIDGLAGSRRAATGGSAPCLRRPMSVRFQSAHPALT